MIKITEELPKIEKAQEKLSHMRSHPKKRNKTQKGHLMNFDCFYFYIPT